MCGIAGFLSENFESSFEDNLNQMAGTLHHRGPDDQGQWSDTNSGIGLCHTRLSILDLSAAGHQPMSSASGRYTLVYNGEIYNHITLRNKLESEEKIIQWRGTSDTETLLACFEKWGMKQTLEKIRGMFAIALWDNLEKKLYLARDRYGEKPLYYGWQKDTFLFGSELKAIKKHPSFQGKINRDALNLFIKYSYIQAPYSIYEGIHKLEPGTFLCLEVDNKLKSKNRDVKAEIYWSLEETSKCALNHIQSLDETKAIKQLDELLSNVIEEQMISDVPLGSFLSGGIDSSTITAIMQAQSERPVETFTIGFNEQDYDEAKCAKAISNHLGTRHEEFYVSPQEALDVIPLLPSLYDEPFADISQIPTYLLSKLTKQRVTVALSGDGGDEIFGGYNRYIGVEKIWNLIKNLPSPFRKTIKKSFFSLASEKSNNKLTEMMEFLPDRFQLSLASDKINKVMNSIDAKNKEDIFLRVLKSTEETENLVLKGREPKIILDEKDTWPEFEDFEHQMMYLDAMTYLPNDILVKVDRAAMGVSLETRVPFLDPRVTEFAWGLPLNMKIRDGKGKWILNQLLSKYIPAELLNRPKMGFSVPLEEWLRGPLKVWAEEMLSEKRLNSEGFFNTDEIRKKWLEHRSGKRDWSKLLWNILMFQAWLDEELLYEK
ncbi:MAG: asparagine synthase (glutamine-hydrolyzing) [Hyphomicrobiales bacterium]